MRPNVDSHSLDFFVAGPPHPHPHRTPSGISVINFGADPIRGGAGALGVCGWVRVGEFLNS